MIIHKLMAFVGTVSVLGLIYPAVVDAGTDGCAPDGKPYSRPLSHFINAQGTTTYWALPASDQLGNTGGEDFCGDLKCTFARIDYTGQNTKELVGPGVAEVSGWILEQPCESGKALTKVQIVVKKPISWAQSCVAICKLAEKNEWDWGYAFTNTPTIFGELPKDVVEGAEPALEGIVYRYMEMTLNKPRDKLPDLSLGNHPDYPSEGSWTGNGYAPKRSITVGSTYGKCADGADCLLHNIQESYADESTGNLPVFTTELTEVIRLDE